MASNTCEAVRSEIPLIAGGGEPSEFARSHLRACPDCSEELESTRQLVAAIGRAPLEHEPSPNLEQRTLERIGISPTPASTWTKATTILVPGLAAAAVVLAVLAAGWHEDARDARKRVQSMQKGAGVPVSTVSLNDRQSHSRAQVTLMSDTKAVSPATSGYHLVVTVNQLPPTPPGYHYELWLIGPKGVVPSIAFPMGKRGDMAFNFPLDVDPHGYPSVEMTLEPDDGDPGMNGATIMRGKLSIGN